VMRLWGGGIDGGYLPHIVISYFVDLLCPNNRTERDVLADARTAKSRDEFELSLSSGRCVVPGVTLAAWELREEPLCGRSPQGLNHGIYY
jgi:hypothetical protein